MAKPDPMSSQSPGSKPPALTLIDGYNLIHAVGVGGPMGGRGDLERARAALIRLLADSLPADQASRTVVVFDAAKPPPGLPRTVEAQGITVHFASDHEDADALLEELIARHSAPRKLTVVSSDHRLQRAARRRKARAVDSEDWHDELLRQRQERARVLAAPVARPEEKPTEKETDETAYWLAQFGEASNDEPAPPPPSGSPAVSNDRRDGSRRGKSEGPRVRLPRPGKRRPQRRKPAVAEPLDPFPPDYGDDVWEEEQRDRRAAD